MLKFLLPLLFLFSGNVEKAPDFEFVDVSGEMQTLSKYEGKVVYLAFWASWCQPCISNFKKYNDMRTTLEENGVVLLNVSLDKKKGDWDKALKRYTFLNGENVHVADLSEVMKLYQLRTIPSYRYINKNMELVDLKGAGDMVKSFEKLLKEK